MGAPVTWLLAKSADLSVVLYPPKGQLSVKCRSAHFDEPLVGVVPESHKDPE